MYFIATIISNNGEAITKIVEAATRDGALNKLDCPAERLVSLRKKAAFDFANLSVKRKKKPNKEAQVIFLQILSGLLRSGRSSQDAVRRLLGAMKSRIKVAKGELTGKYEVSEILEALEFDSSAVIMAQVGEDTSNLPEMLSKASQNIMNYLKIREDMWKGVRTGGIYFTLGIAIFIGLPLFIAPEMTKLLAKKQIILPINIATDILLILNHIYINFWWAILAALGSITVFNKVVWTFLKPFPFFRSIHEFQKNMRGLTFLVAYRPLYEAGINTDRALRLIRENAGKSMRLILDEMIKQIALGADISDVLNTEHWPIAIRDGFIGFAGLDAEQRMVVIDQQIETLSLDLKVVGRQIGSTFNMMGTVLIVLSIASAAIGFYLPLLSMSSAGGL
ncbi:MAG: hypothetical protein D6B27_09565 [Gammaproteobacteria bacterium]|nr:MAG: hypothetical protein D6B27_09565 [Gammaproteobacteria bacterium]